MKIFSWLLPVFIGGLSLCSINFSTIHEERIENDEWTKLSRVPEDTVVPVWLALTQQNVDKSEEFLLDVSHPASPNYGNHWSLEKVVEVFQPSNQTQHSVRTWLENNGISSKQVLESDNKAWWHLETTVKKLEHLLDTTYYHFMDAHGNTAFACDRYHLPPDLQTHIDYIEPGVVLPQVKRTKQQPCLTKRSSAELEGSASGFEITDADSLKDCDTLVTPACIRALYNIPLNPNRKVHPNNSLGIFEFPPGYNQTYFNSFFKQFAPFIPPNTHPIPAPITHDPIRDKSGHFCNDELGLDFEIAYPIIYPQKTTLYLSDGFPVQFLEGIEKSFCKGRKSPNVKCGKYRPTHTISVSFDLPEHGASEALLRRSCHAFTKLALQGTSVFVASGDQGVLNQDCYGGKNPFHGKFGAEWPATCVAVTGVGATRIRKGKTVNDAEAAMIKFPHQKDLEFLSGGGFSYLFKRPKWQDKALNTYLQEHNPGYKSFHHFGFHNISQLQGRYNRAGRGFPDVSANGVNIAVVDTKKVTRDDGTSASAPLFAAIMTRINDERLNAGKSPVGFVNPVFYEHPEMFNDITLGGNPGCGTDGFAAVKGWDPITGLGTPDFLKMREVFMSLP